MCDLKTNFLCFKELEINTSSASGGENSGISFAAGRPTEAFGAKTLDIPKIYYMNISFLIRPLGSLLPVLYWAGCWEILPVNDVRLLIP